MKHHGCWCLWCGHGDTVGIHVDYKLNSVVLPLSGICWVSRYPASYLMDGKPARNGLNATGVDPR